LCAGGGYIAGVTSPDQTRAAAHPLDAAMRLSLLGVAVGGVLAATKIAAGLIGHSFALVADGLESCLDIVYGVAAWLGYRWARQPADENHRYGHGKAEALMALAASLVLLAGAGALVWQSVLEIRAPQQGPAPFTLVVLVAVVVVKEGFFRRLMKTAAARDSVAVQADAWHHRSDALTSIAAFLGISIALVGGEGWESADGWAALVACGVIAGNGARILRGSLREIMDTAPSPSPEERIREVLRGVEGVAAIEKCRIRRSGLTLFVDVHVEVDGDLSVREGHTIAHRVKRALAGGEFGVVDTLVHIEPHRRRDPADSRCGS
jgi:cation diffusion facilitator family transporter